MRKQPTMRSRTRREVKEEIPRSLHQMWLDRVEMDNEEAVPASQYPKYRQYTSDWKTRNPEFTYTFWNKRRVHDMWMHDERLSKWRDFFLHTIERHIEKCDFSRYALLYLHGGVYVDLDFQCVRPLLSAGAQLFAQHPSFGWAYEPEERWKTTIGQYVDLPLVSNSFLMSTRGHWVWPRLMDDIMDQYDAKADVLVNTGPVRLQLFVEKHNIKSMHPDYFIDTCLILPMIDNHTVSKPCLAKHAAADATQASQQVLDDAYCYTRWKEGTGWWWENEATRQPVYHVTQTTAVAVGSGMIALMVLVLVLLVIVIWLLIDRRRTRQQVSHDGGGKVNSDDLFINYE